MTEEEKAAFRAVAQCTSETRVCKDGDVWRDELGAIHTDETIQTLADFEFVFLKKNEQGREVCAISAKGVYAAKRRGFISE